jgi:hypothetical protein
MFSPEGWMLVLELGNLSYAGIVRIFPFLSNKFEYFFYFSIFCHKKQDPVLDSSKSRELNPDSRSL